MIGKVILEWRNGLGNCLFQYAFARLFAERYGMELCHTGVNGKTCFKNPVEYGLIDLKKVSSDEKRIDIYKISSQYGQYEKYFNLESGKVSKMSFSVGYPGYIRGLIEDYRIYCPYQELIKSWFKPVDYINHKDLVFHIRLGDNWKTADRDWETLDPCG